MSYRRQVLAALFSILFVAAATPATASVNVENQMQTAHNSSGNDGLAVYRYGSGNTVSADFATGTHNGTLEDAGELELDLTGGDWWDYAYTARQCFSVNASAGGAEYPVRLVVDTSSGATGDDIRVVVGTNGTELPVYVEGPVPSTRTIVYAKVAPLATGPTTYCVYFDNPAATSTSDELATFTYTGQAVRYYTMLDTYQGNGVDSRTSVVSLVDGNTVSDGTSTVVLDAGDVHDFSRLDLHSVITATGPIAASHRRQSKEALVPESFADSQFSFPTSRFTERFAIRSPFGSTTVEAVNNGVVLGSVTVGPADGTVQLTADVGGTDFVTLRSTGGADFLAVHHPTNDEDIFIGVPWYGDDLYGVGSADANVAAAAAAAISYQLHDGTGNAAVSVGPDSMFVITGNGGGGNGRATRLSSTGRVAAIQQDDGTGTESSSFLPERLLGQTYRLPTRVGYLAAACPVPGTQVRVNGGAPSTCSGSGVGHWWTGTNYSAGTLIEANNPIFLYFENESDDEHNLFSAKVHTPYLSLVSAIGGVVELLDEVCGDWTSAPLVTAGNFGLASLTASVQTETSVSFQLSIDGGATFFGPDGTDTTGFVEGDIVPYLVDNATSIILRVELCTSNLAAIPTVSDAGVEHSLVALAPTVAAADRVVIPSSTTTTDDLPVLRVYSHPTDSWQSRIDYTSGTNLAAGTYTIKTDHPSVQIAVIGGTVSEPSPPQAHDAAAPYSILVDHATNAGQTVTITADVIDDGPIRLATAIQFDFAG